MFKHVENNPFLVREMDSKAILNTDEVAYKAIMNNKKRKAETDNQLQKEIAELKSLVEMLLKERNN